MTETNARKVVFVTGAASGIGRAAAVAVWLCEDAPGFLTGQAIAVDGGAGA